MLVHISTPYEETFIRRNAVLKFLQRFAVFHFYYFQYSPFCPGPSRISTSRLSRQSHRMHLRVVVPFHFHSATPAIWSSVRCTTSTTTRKPVPCSACSFLVLYPPLEPGDRVIRGPDWMWGNQDGNSEGTVIRRKEWKGVKDMGVEFAEEWDVDHCTLG